MPLIEPDEELSPTTARPRHPGLSSRMVDELLASPFELPSRMAGFRGGAKESGKGRMRTPKHLSDEASLAYDDDDALGRGNISPLSSPMSTRRCQSIVDPLESFETSSVTGPCGSAVASGRNGRMRYLADEDRLEDDDDDALGRGNVSPMSSPMSTRRCQSIIDPFEDHVAELTQEADYDAESAADDDDDLYDERLFTWKKRAKASEALLQSREEELDAQILAHQRLQAVLTKSEQALARRVRDMEMLSIDVQLQKDANQRLQAELTKTKEELAFRNAEADLSKESHQLLQAEVMKTKKELALRVRDMELQNLDAQLEKDSNQRLQAQLTKTKQELALRENELQKRDAELPEDSNKRLLLELTKTKQELALRDNELQSRDSELQKLRKQMAVVNAHQETKAQECASVAAWLHERRAGILTQRSSTNATFRAEVVAPTA